MAEDQRPLTVSRAQGGTASERYLAVLSRRTFLSLWSYPNLFKEPGKELCDLLVLFENDVLIFSDKHCTYPTTADVAKNWSRWFKKAVLSSVSQLRGAQRWIATQRDRVFLDSRCAQRLPFDLPNGPQARVHLIATVRGVAAACAAHHQGGSGSLMLRTDVGRAEIDKVPFTIGDVNPDGTLVHVFDDTTLDVVLRTLDTISDLMAYLRKKEAFLRSARPTFVAGEEELLALYLRHMNEDGEHDFDVPSDASHVAVMEGPWAEFQTSDQRRRQMEANRVSYVWDALIEQFAKHAMAGTQYFRAPGGLTDTERILRFMARESRTRRRMLGRRLIEMLETTPEHMRRINVAKPSTADEPYYAFLLLPHLPGRTEEEYRVVRRNHLYALCMVVKHLHPEARDIVGIATDAGMGDNRSEDAIVLDAREWSDELEKEAVELRQRLGILITPTRTDEVESEYPD